MYQTLTVVHSLTRWAVLIFLVLALIQAYTGLKKQRTFSATDNFIRHWTATIVQIQLVIGLFLYFISPMVSYFWDNTSKAFENFEIFFFSLIHFLFMTIAVSIVTIGSMLAKRRERDEEKFRTMFNYFLIALILIFIAIPWPFSPLAHRPLWR